jgi:undecaprenyl diphosphate synthase
MATGADSRNLPQHIAVVMDGNGRWAEKRFLPVASGHKAGVETVRTVMDACKEAGVNNLTLFAFSSENWSRPTLEVRALMQLFSSYIDNEVEELCRKDVRLRFIGRRDRLAPELVRKMEWAEQKTAACNQFHLTLAVDYGGQWELVEATRAIAEKVQAGLLSPSAITTETIAAHTCLAGLPPPDLLIRTSGEYRISNFLLWHLAYAEFYFTDVFWPDFGRRELDQALEAFACRNRRFGGRNEVAGKRCSSNE